MKNLKMAVLSLALIFPTNQLEVVKKVVFKIIISKI